MKRLALFGTALLTAIGAVACSNPTAPGDARAARAADAKQQLESATKLPTTTSERIATN